MHTLKPSGVASPLIPAFVDHRRHRNTGSSFSRRQVQKRKIYPQFVVRVSGARTTVLPTKGPGTTALCRFVSSRDTSPCVIIPNSIPSEVRVCQQAPDSGSLGPSRCAQRYGSIHRPHRSLAANTSRDTPEATHIYHVVLCLA